MKTSNIENIVNRISQAKNVTQNLVEKSQKFAQFIENEMDKLGVDSLMGGKYELITIRASAGSDTSLYLNIHNEWDMLNVCLDVSRIDSERDSCLLYGDFNASYNLPNRDDILTFTSDAEKLLKELANMDKGIKTPLIDMVLAQASKGA